MQERIHLRFPETHEVLRISLGFYSTWAEDGHVSCPTTSPLPFTHPLALAYPFHWELRRKTDSNTLGIGPRVLCFPTQNVMVIQSTLKDLVFSWSLRKGSWQADCCSETGQERHPRTIHSLHQPRRHRSFSTSEEPGNAENTVSIPMASNQWGRLKGNRLHNYLNSRMIQHYKRCW